MAAGEDVEDVLDDGAGGRGDDADAGGKGGDGEFAGGVEEAFELEAVAELVEGEAEGAVADGLEGVGDELHLTAAFVDADAAAGEDLEAVLGTEAEQLRARAEEDGGDLGVAVFKSEINVAAGSGTAVGDFSFDADLRKLLLDVTGEGGDEGFYGPDAGRSGRGGGCRNLRLRREEELLEERLVRSGIWFGARHHPSVKEASVAAAVVARSWQLRYKHRTRFGLNGTEELIRALAVVGGVMLLFSVLLDAFETIILPRRTSSRYRLTRGFYVATWGPWGWLSTKIQNKRQRESWLSFYGPLSLPVLLGVWATLLVVGYGLLFYGVGSPFEGQHGMPGFRRDLYVSGTTLFTLGLGDVVPTSAAARLLLIIESGNGLGFLAVVVGYLPVLYGAFATREVDIALLDARAGSPPSGVELLRRHAYPGGEEQLVVLLEKWERWAAELLESHISYPVLCYFRSQHDNQSWLSALVAVLDASALLIAGVEGHCARQAELTYAICRHALVDVAQIFVLRPEPKPSQRRLAEGGYLEVAKELCKDGLKLDRSPQAEARLTELRALYEGYASALSDYLRMPIEGWLFAPNRKDNWRTVARLPGVDKAAQEANPFLRPETVDEQH